MNKKKIIHPSIKECVGFDSNLSDKEFLKEWKNKATQVCKPCWELKYCPYGPFVEQSPILPPLRESVLEHNQYLSNCILTNMIGSIRKLTDEEIEEKREIYEIIKTHPKFLLPEIFRDLNDENLIKEGIEKGLGLFDLYKTPYDNFEKYNVPFPLNKDEEKRNNEILDEILQIKLTPELRKRIKEKKQKLKETIESGVEDNRKPLDPLRKKYFEKEIAKFNPNEYPDYIPQIVSETSCNIWGHICPVIFVGESVTETTEKRRKGRYIPFQIKMRVVRRDNYTCQECGVHLKDDEVEFDHIIPISKGGSSEEHNIRLTCYDCNREKLDTVNI